MPSSSPYPKPIVVAEVGDYHNGSLDIAIEMVSMAKKAGANFVKYSKKNPKLWLSPVNYHKPHPNIAQAFATTIGQHAEIIELSLANHAELKQRAALLGIGYAVSVWDKASASEMASLKPGFIKVPGACNTNIELLKILRDHYDGDVHISFAMTTPREEEAIVQFFEEKKQARERLVIYNSIAASPLPYGQVCMLEIARQKKKYHQKVKGFGFAGHHLGIGIDVAAYALGATYIERHMTFDKTAKGINHITALDPLELQQLVTNLNNTHAALTFKETEILEIEAYQRMQHKYTNPL